MQKAAVQTKTQPQKPSSTQSAGPSKPETEQPEPKPDPEPSDSDSSDLEKSEAEKPDPKHAEALEPDTQESDTSKSSTADSESTNQETPTNTPEPTGTTARPMSLASLVGALDGLQHDASRRKEYNDWLQEFQRSPKAWEVVYEVLGSEGPSRAIKIFSAQTLRNKIAFDLHQVPRDARLHLKEQVLVLLEKNVELLSVVGVQLCIALAALAMQVAEWESPIEELMTRFASTEMVPLLFEFLKVLPEEFSSPRAGMVDPSLRLQRSTSLVQDSAPTVLNFMMSRADVMATQGATQSLFFEALKPWLNEIDLPQIMASPLVDWIVSGVENDEARTPAVDCFITILRETSEVRETHVQEAITALFPKIVALAPRYTPLYEDNEDMLRDFTRLFSEAGQAWHVLIAREPQSFMPLLRAVAQCMATPGIDLETAEYTFDFFDHLRSVIGEPLPGSPPDNRQAEREPFVPIFLQMLSSFTQMLEFPVTFDNNHEEEEIFRDFRYDIGDMLKICGSIVGHEQVLKWCYEQVSQLIALQRSLRFQPVEAMLFCIRALARIVPFEESVWMPRIYERLSDLPFQNEELIQHAVLMLLGRYSQWTAKHPESLAFALQYVTTSVWSPLPEVRRASAHAFLYLCTDASAEMVTFLPRLLQLYTTIADQIPRSDMDLESFAKYSDGLGAVINQLRGPDLQHAIMTVFEPASRRATLLVQRVTSDMGSNMPLSEQERQVSYEVQGLGGMIAMISAIDVPEENIAPREHPLIVAVRMQHQLFANILGQLGPYKESILDAFSRYYIRVLFNIGSVMQIEVRSLMQAVAGVMTVRPLSPVLYELSSAIVQCFNLRQDTSPELVPEVWHYAYSMSRMLLSEDVLAQLKDQGGVVEQFTTISAVLHHGFHLLCDIAVYFPSEFFANLLDPAVKLSIHTLNYAWDTEVLISVSHFYDDIESFLPRAGHEAINLEIPAKISAVFEARGYELVHSLFYLFLLKPDKYFEPMAERMVDLVFRVSPVSSVAWLQQLLLTLPEGTISDEEKLVFAQQILQHASTGNSKVIGREMNLFVKAYAARNLSAR